MDRRTLFEIQNAGVDEPYLRFMQHATLAIPPDPLMKAAYAVYKTSLKTKKLASEQGRTLRADAFIEPNNLGPLSTLCIHAIAQTTLPHELIDMTRENPTAMRHYYDNLNIDLPLEKCCNIDDEAYWKRVVLAKTSVLSTFSVKDWKKEGISVKFVKYLESLPAEFYNEKEMRELSLKIRDYIIDLHIAHMRPVMETTYKKALQSEHDTDSDLSSTSSSNTDHILSSDSSGKIESPDKGEGASKWQEYEEVEEEEESWRDDDEDEEEGEEEYEESEETLLPTNSRIRFELRRKKLLKGNKNEMRLGKPLDKAAAKAKLREKREKKRQRRERREEKLQAEEAEALRLEEEKRAAEEALQKAMKVNLKPIRPTKNNPEGELKSIFDFAIEPPEEDIFADAIDGRKKEELCALQQQMDTYNDYYCTHYNLSFLRYFPYLESLYLEFSGPENQLEYDIRNHLFSIKDIEHLANGLAFLHNLKVFRFCNSKTTAEKLSIVTSALKDLESIETISFRSDGLEDDCCDAIYELFQGTTTIKSLELGRNSLSEDTLEALGESLKNYGGCLVYLGLEWNPLSENALHKLTEVIAPTKQIKELNLRGLSLTQSTLFCCIAIELLTIHKALQSLDLCQVKIDREAALRIQTALQMNLNVYHLDLRDTDMDEDLELEITMLVKRNKFSAENPSIGNAQLSVEQIDEQIRQSRHPILLSAMENVAKREQCIAKRSTMKNPFLDDSESDLQINLQMESLPRTPRFSDDTRTSILTQDVNVLFRFDNENDACFEAEEEAGEEEEEASEETASPGAPKLRKESIIKNLRYRDESFYSYLRNRHDSVKYDVEY